MNFYQHHIGDYMTDTAHLSALEDCFYRRALDWYYANEKPLPLDKKKIFRFLRGKSKDELAAIENILEEFFALADDGYHQSRCDEEISKYHEELPEIEAKRENTKERQRRTRENRKIIFEILRHNGIVPAYDAPMSHLKALLKPFESQLGNALVTRDSDVTSQESFCDATANHIPIPNYQLPIPNNIYTPLRVDDSNSVDNLPFYTPPKDEGRRISWVDMGISQLPEDWRKGVLKDWPDLHQDDFKAKWTSFTAHFTDKSGDLKTRDAWFKRWTAWMAQDAVKLIDDRKRRENFQRTGSKSEDSNTRISRAEIEQKAHRGETYEEAEARLIRERRNKERVA